MGLFEHLYDIYTIKNIVRHLYVCLHGYAISLHLLSQPACKMLLEYQAKNLYLYIYIYVCVRLFPFIFYPCIHVHHDKQVIWVSYISSLHCFPSSFVSAVVVVVVKVAIEWTVWLQSECIVVKFNNKKFNNKNSTIKIQQ